MKVLLFGASGRIGQRIAAELHDRGHKVTAVSRNGTSGLEKGRFSTVTCDATDADSIAEIADGHDVVASALGPGKRISRGVYDNTKALPGMARSLVEGCRLAGIDRLIWTGNASGLKVTPGKRVVDTFSIPRDWRPLALAHVDAYEVIRQEDNIKWTSVTPPLVIEPGERTRRYRTELGALVMDRNGRSYISMEDFAVAFCDELDHGHAIHYQLGVGY